MTCAIGCSGLTWIALLASADPHFHRVAVQPFTSDSGAFVVNQFSFKQPKTAWPQFLESTVNILEQAKAESATAARDDHLQYVLLS
jgi:hypothetical protein